MIPFSQIAKDLPLNLSGSLLLDSKAGIIKYDESLDTHFELTLHENPNSKKDNRYDYVVYISWIQGKGQGDRLFEMILKIIQNISSQNGSKIMLFYERETISSTFFIQKLISNGYKFIMTDSPVNYGEHGYALFITPEA